MSSLEEIIEYVEKTVKRMKTPDLVNVCCTCGNWLHHIDVFPKDFPDEWKMCCSCFSYAKEIIEMGDVQKVISTWITIVRIDCRKSFIAKLMKIGKLIKVV